MFVPYKDGLREKDFFYVAFSAGVDSVGVVSWLVKNKYTNFGLMHFNHGIQPINEVMEAKAIALAEKLNLKIEIIHNTKTDDKSEAALRDARMEAYSSLNRDVVTCHHIDDAVESYLMNSFNGVGGYLPIPTATQLPSTNYLFRPFMLCTKAQLIRQVKQPYFDLSDYVVEDPTNRENGYRRNWIRNVVRPLIEQQYPGLEKIVRKRYLDAYAVTDEGKATERVLKEIGLA